MHSLVNYICSLHLVNFLFFLNLMQDENLKFVKGIDSKQSEYFYDVTLEAMDGEKVNVYEARVWERPRQELLSFMLVGEAPLLI